MAKKKITETNEQATGAPAPAAPARRRTTTRRNKVDAATASDAAVSAPPAELGVSSTYIPTFEEIAEAAYRRFIQRGGLDGRDFDDWIEAEQELRTRR